MKINEIKIRREADLIWLKSHFKPEECFLLGDFWYGIIEQADETYAIKRVQVSRCDLASDEGEWLQWPEKRYETLGGAYYAILLNADTHEENKQ